MSLLPAKRKLPSWMSQSKASKSSVDNEEIKKGGESRLEKLCFPGKISYCYQKEECNFVCAELLSQSLIKKVVLGFDIEWKVTYTKGDYRKTSVLQLCQNSNRCYIFQLNHMNGFPQELHRLLEDENVIKVGVGIQGDMNRLQNDYNIHSRGVCDLGTVADKKLGNAENWSLNGLLQNQLKLQISKEHSVRCSDWEAIPLTDTQLQYAALDAYQEWICDFFEMRGVMT